MRIFLTNSLCFQIMYSNKTKCISKNWKHSSIFSTTNELLPTAVRNINFHILLRNSIGTTTHSWPGGNIPEYIDIDSSRRRCSIVHKYVCIVPNERNISFLHYYWSNELNQSPCDMMMAEKPFRSMTCTHLFVPNCRRCPDARQPLTASHYSMDEWNKKMYMKKTAYAKICI